MQKIDTEFTARIQQWLETPAADRDILAGATLLLQLNRNRALFNSITTRPSKYADKLEYELRKHLRIRLANMAVADVVRLEAKVMPAAERTIEDSVVLSTSDETPAAVHHGRRADHDTLPAEIRVLWDDNGPRYHRIKLLFEELKGMADAEPCDRYEKLQLLAEEDAKYRDSLAIYDSYVAGSPVVVTDNSKVIAATRKTLSKYKRAYLAAEDPDKRAAVLAKIQECVTTLEACRATFSDSSIAELRSWGVQIG